MIIEIEPNWKNKAAVCIAGGVSLTKEQINKIPSECKIIAVNNAYQICPHADILYACDRKWWDWHKGAPDFKGYRLQHEFNRRIGNETTMKPYPGIDIIRSTGHSGFSRDCRFIRHGGNGGYQALHIAMLKMARIIILLGYDMHDNTGKGHWHGQHPNYRHDSTINVRYEGWRREFTALADAAIQRGQKIINCSPGSALKCFTSMTIDEAVNLVNFNKESKQCQY